MTFTAKWKPNRFYIRFLRFLLCIYEFEYPFNVDTVSATLLLISTLNLFSSADFLCLFLTTGISIKDFPQTVSENKWKGERQGKDSKKIFFFLPQEKSVEEENQKHIIDCLRKSLMLNTLNTFLSQGMNHWWKAILAKQWRKKTNFLVLLWFSRP